MKPACDHNLLVHSNDRLSVRDAETGEEHATARRSNGVWYVSADGVPDANTPHLHEEDGGVIKLITDHATAKVHATLGADEKKTGYSTWVPHEARKLHGEDAFYAWTQTVGLFNLKF
jgi:hypothetical protein